MRVHREAGFTLIEIVVAVALIALAGGAAGTFFLGGASPAVASAARDLRAALDEAQRTAAAFDTASLVIVPAGAGAGYRARVYRGAPGDAAFGAQNGPDYASTAAVAETIVPLGTPEFAFAFGRRGGVSAYTNVFTAPAAHVCPAAGAFSLHVYGGHEARDIAIPCVLPANETAAAAFASPGPAWTPPPEPDRSCPEPAGCAPPPLPAGPPALCPPGTSADAMQAGLCDRLQAPSTPAPTPTPCPLGFSGTAPVCTGEIIEQYSAKADQAQPHTATLFANGSICDDGGCSARGPIAWAWGCAFDARRGTDGTNGTNPPYQTYNPYFVSVGQTIAFAFHDAAEGSGTGIVSTSDAYCTGVAAPS